MAFFGDLWISAVEAFDDLGFRCLQPDIADSQTRLKKGLVAVSVLRLGSHMFLVPFRFCVATLYTTDSL